jgi:hypothetical protein
MDRQIPHPYTPRAWARWRKRLLVAAFVCGVTPEVMADTRTITGHIIYGTINNDIGETTPPTNLIPVSSPVKHVRVEFNDGAGLPVGDPVITNAQGFFSITFHGTPNITLVTKAENDYIAVKKHQGLGDNWFFNPLLKTYRDISGRINYNTCQDGDTCDIGVVTVVSDTIDSFETETVLGSPIKNYVSRAFYITTVGHASGTRVEAVGPTLPGEKLRVRLGIDALFTRAWYYQIDNTIYVANNEAMTIWHEYGHFVQDKIGVLPLVPPYLVAGHAACAEITDMGSNTPNLTWGYLEGLATWFGTLDATHHYGGYSQMMAALDSVEYDIETTQCDAGEIASWTDPRAVESVVSNVLWDLIDDVEDPDNGSGIEETSEATANEVVAVMSAATPPRDLDEFWDIWRQQHGGLGVVVPDLYASYALNGAARGHAVDLTPPDPVTLASSSHPVGGAWSNDPSVTLTITDGADDVSGSYWYFVTADGTSNTMVSTSGPETFKSKLTVNDRDVAVPDGRNQYIHVNTQDMARHTGTGTAHYGPIRIDTVDPFLVGAFQVIPFRIDPTVPSSDPTMMLGYPAEISWGSNDALSGVATVSIAFEDTFSGFSVVVHTTSAKSGTFSWLVTDVPVTANGQLTITVTDRAGNDLVASIPAPVVAPFSGPITTNLGNDADPCEGGRVISADLHRDGFDDVVLVCRFNGTGHLYVLRGTSNGLSVSQDFPWSPADDLTAADIDRDGDLDVVTVSLAAPGVATQAEILYNDGTGTLVDPGIALPLGPLSQKTVRVVNPLDSRRPVIAVFGVQPGIVPAIVAFDVPSGFTVVTLPGVVPVAGDWEAGDVNGDGYADLVALGFDGFATQALTLFAGSAGGWSRQDLEAYGSVANADVDVADFDSDGLQDVSVMFEDAGLARITKLLRKTGAAGGYQTFAAAGVVEQQVAQGDGFIVDTANDAFAEVIDMGLTDVGDISGWYLRNDAVVGTIQDTAIAAMTPLFDTDSAWGDFDADGDLDMFQIGRDAMGFHIARYENLLGTYIDQNDVPKPPTNLTATYDPVRSGYTFSWAAPLGSTDETPVAGFGYELRVGTTVNGNEILSWAHPAGASQQGQRLDRFVRMPAGTYWFSVRTVDSGWMRSQPAPIKRTIP